MRSIEIITKSNDNKYDTYRKNRDSLSGVRNDIHNSDSDHNHRDEMEKIMSDSRFSIRLIKEFKIENKRDKYSNKRNELHIYSCFEIRYKNTIFHNPDDEQCQSTKKYFDILNPRIEEEKKCRFKKPNARHDRWFRSKYNEYRNREKRKRNSEISKNRIFLLFTFHKSCRIETDFQDIGHRITEEEVENRESHETIPENHTWEKFGNFSIVIEFSSDKENPDDERNSQILQVSLTKISIDKRSKDICKSKKHERNNTYCHKFPLRLNYGE